MSYKVTLHSPTLPVTLLVVTIALARSRSPPQQRSARVQRQLPAAAFRNSLRLRILSMACQKNLLLIAVKLSECTERGTVGATCKSVRVRGRAASSFYTLRIPQRSSTLPLFSYCSTGSPLGARWLIEVQYNDVNAQRANVTGVAGYFIPRIFYLVDIIIP